MKDSGSYGPVTITQAISIVSEGFLAQVSVPSGGVGVTVSAGSSDKVILQGLVIDGHGIGKDGIDFNSGDRLAIEDCHVRNVTYAGILLDPTDAEKYYVSNTDISGSGLYGAYVNPSNSAPNGTFFRVEIHDNVTGIRVSNSNLVLINSVISGNQTGLIPNNNGNILLGETVVSANYTGIVANGGIVNSYDDNYINANDTDISGSLSNVQKR